MWGDFDRTTGVTRIGRQLKSDGGWPVATEATTFRSRRAINLPTTMRGALVEHERRQRDERERRGTRWLDSGFIFTTSKGMPSVPRNFYRCVRTICDAAGLEHWHPHERRHSTASLILSQGVTLHVVSQALGH